MPKPMFVVWVRELQTFIFIQDKHIFSHTKIRLALFLTDVNSKYNPYPVYIVK